MFFLSGLWGHVFHLCLQWVHTLRAFRRCWRLWVFALRLVMGNYPRRQKCLVRRGIEKRNPRTETSAQTRLVAQRGRQLRERQDITTIFKRCLSMWWCFIWYLRFKLRRLERLQIHEEEGNTRSPVAVASQRPKLNLLLVVPPLCPDIPQTCGCICFHKWATFISASVMDRQTGQSVKPM